MARRPKKYKYHIILANRGKMLSDLYWCDTLEKVYDKYNKMKEDNARDVLFPIKFNNEKDKIVEAEYELIIIKGRDSDEEESSKIRNEFGKFITYESSDYDWIIFDRSPYFVEETFWVYGYHPKLQRKSYKWIFDEFIAKDARNKFTFRSVQLFKNKLIVDCNSKLDIVICKNVHDAIRLYNAMVADCVKQKFKYIVFMGDVSYGRKKKEWTERIEKLTNWPRKKILRSSTRP